MLGYINSLGLDAQKIGNVVMGRLPSAMLFCVGGIACSVDRMEQTQGGAQARIDCAAGEAADPTSPSISLPMAQLLITRQTPVQTSHFSNPASGLLFYRFVYILSRYPRDLRRFDDIYTQRGRTLASSHLSHSETTRHGRETAPSGTPSCWP
jgi:hypothetical protein